MKLNIFQIITLILLIAFAVYELFYIPQWLESLSDDNPPIRTDLILFTPILIICVIISVIQFIKNRK